MNSFWTRFKWLSLFEQVQLSIGVLAFIVGFFTLFIAWKALSKVDYLSTRLFIGELADRCKWERFDGGDYESYKILKAVGAKNNDPLIRSMVDAQLLNLRSSYLDSDALVMLIPILRNENNSLVPENDTKPHWDNVLSQNNHSFWRTRAKVVYLLRNSGAQSYLSKEKILKILISHIENDSSFVVKKTALDSYRSLTQFEEENVNNVFDFEGAIKDFHNRLENNLSN